MQIKRKYKNSMNKGLSHNKGPFAADQGGPLLWEATVLDFTNYLLDIRYSAQRAFVFLYFGIAYSSNKKIITFHRIISSKSQ